MLDFSRLTQLNEHTTWLQSQMQTKDFYLVGGVVRDLLLGSNSESRGGGIDKPIVDVDITGPHHPDQWWDMIDKRDISTFRTEKFGTMTLIKSQITNHKSQQVTEIKNEELSLIEKTENGYYMKSSSLPPVDGTEEKQRKTVGILIKHWSENKYLVAQWPTGQKWFPGGGVEDGETYEQAAIREMIEESGYYDYEIISSNFPIIEVYFNHPAKKYNLTAYNGCVVIKLLSDKQYEVSDEEKLKHNLIWVDSYLIRDSLNSPIHQMYRNRYHAMREGAKNLDQVDQDFVDRWNGEVKQKMDCFVVPPRLCGGNQCNDEQVIQYEITPFRCEGGYEDFRHPGEIQWSTSLLDDAKRRDFTINCLYYTSLSEKSDKTREIRKTNKSDAVAVCDFDPEKYVKQGYWYDEASGTLCICDHELIEKVQNGIKVCSKWVEEVFGPMTYDLGPIHLIIDPYQGLVDLCEGTVRCVGEPDHRFQEDALRILRGLRFVNTLNQVSQIQWDFHRDTWRSMQKYHFLIQHLAKERIKQEITKVFSMKNPFGYVALLDELKLLPLIFPAIAKIKGLEQPVRYHPLDTYHHTLMTLWHLQKLNDNYLVKLAMLYHDVGKVEQYKLYDIGLTREEMTLVHGSWLNHTVCGPDFVRRDFSALGFSNAEIDYVAWLVQYHMYPGQILMAKPENQIKKLRTLLAESSYEQMQDLLDVMEGDRLGHYNPIQSQAELNGPEQLRIMLDKIYHDEGQITLGSLEIDGQVLMDSLKLEPSKILGKLLKKCLEYVLHDPTRNTKEELIKFAKKEVKKLS